MVFWSTASYFSENLFELSIKIIKTLLIRLKGATLSSDKTQQELVDITTRLTQFLQNYTITSLLYRTHFHLVSKKNKM